MPFIRGLREYRYYNDDENDHQMSYEEIQAIRLSQVPKFEPIETLAPIAAALRNLPKELAEHVEKVPPSSEVNVEESGAGKPGEEPQQFFAEDVLPSSDVTVTVEGMGVLKFPFEADVTAKLVEIMTIKKVKKTTEGSVNRPTTYGETQFIPSGKLNVEFKEESLNTILKKTKESLNINKESVLKPILRCMFIYGPRQFCGMHKGSDRDDPNSVRLVIVLPSRHEGGNLVVKHGTQIHKFSSSGSLDTLKWLAFYSDCQRQVLEVEDGYRVVLTYGVEVQPPAGSDSLNVGEVCVETALKDAVADYFSHETCPNRLFVFLLHRYSEKTLGWHRIKGRDLTYARALLAVAECQDLVPYLALGRCLETWETSGYHGPVRNGASVELDTWMDRGGNRVNRSERVDYNRMAREVCTFRPEFWSLGEPDEERRLGWYGEGPAIREQWYYKACVVLEKKG